MAGALEKGRVLMGFRSTCVTSETEVEWPEWFRVKYERSFWIPKDGVIASKFEVKDYDTLGESLAEDIQKVMQDVEQESKKKLRDIVLIWLHECGGVTKVRIKSDRVVYMLPTQWHEVDGVVHWYCYGCSEAP
jgi:hypothetical protein